MKTKRSSRIIESLLTQTKLRQRNAQTAECPEGKRLPRRLNECSGSSTYETQSTHLRKFCAQVLHTFCSIFANMFCTSFAHFLIQFCKHGLHKFCALFALVLHKFCTLSALVLQTYKILYLTAFESTVKKNICAWSTRSWVTSPWGNMILGENQAKYRALDWKNLLYFSIHVSMCNSCDDSMYILRYIRDGARHITKESDAISFLHQS